MIFSKFSTTFLKFGYSDFQSNYIFIQISWGWITHLEDVLILQNYKDGTLHSKRKFVNMVGAKDPH